MTVVVELCFVRLSESYDSFWEIRIEPSMLFVEAYIADDLLFQWRATSLPALLVHRVHTLPSSMLYDLLPSVVRLIRARWDVRFSLRIVVIDSPKHGK